MNKLQVDDLALFGGAALFETVRPIGQLALPEEEEFFTLARSIYDCKGLTNNGPLVQELEHRLEQMHQVKHCIAFASASLALILLMEIVADGRHGEVIMPAFTYAGLPHLAQWAGQLPCFCDVDCETHTLDPAVVLEAVCEDTTAILAVHQVTSPCRINELEALAAKCKVPLIFDSVHGIHCTYKGRPIGGFGRAEVFSLHATKLLNGFEGGYITTNDYRLANVLRMKRNFGIDSQGNVATKGLNAKLNEFHAASALACLEDQQRVVDRNRQRLLAYHEHFHGIPGLSWVPYQNENERMNYEFALLEVDPTWPLKRDVIVELLRAENALARPYYSPPVHRSTHCPDFIEPPSLPVTEELARTIIQMPVGELVSRKDIFRLGAFFHFIHTNAREIAERLNPTGGV